MKRQVLGTATFFRRTHENLCVADPVNRDSSHYIKVIQRENLGGTKERVDLQRDLDQWIKQYVADMDNPSPGVRARRPLRQAQITVDDIPGQPGWYKVGMKVRPHMKYMGAFFDLSLVGKLEKPK